MLTHFSQRQEPGVQGTVVRPLPLATNPLCTTQRDRKSNEFKRVADPLRASGKQSQA